MPYPINIKCFSDISSPFDKVDRFGRVATDLENLEKSGNLKETSESQGICLKSQGICTSNHMVWRAITD